MNLKRIAATSLLAVSLTTAGLGAGAGVAHADSAYPTPTPPSTCLPNNADDTWPVWADGQPPRSPGVTVWHDAHGWHVRVTHNTIHDRVFSGAIATKGELVDVTRVRLEKNDYLVVAPGKHLVLFRFNNYGGIDGFDFATHCAPSLAFGLLSDGHPVPVGRISIGAGQHHPPADPFAITRTA